MARSQGGTKAGWSRAGRRWVGLALACCVALAAFGVDRADAEIRFSAPGGTGSAPCLRTDPCTLYLAASYEAPAAERIHSGDEVVVLPGEYSGARGDLGPDEIVQFPGQSYIHGEVGAPVPLIVSDRHGWVLTLASHESVASDLEIIAPNSSAPLLVSLSTAERMVVRTSAERGIACSLGFRGVVRDSLCISSGRKGAGAGQHVHTNSFTEHTRTLRNVTAIGTGPESNGIRFDISGGEIFASVKSSIARGTATDIEAIGEEPGGGPTVTVEASNYATASAVEKDGGTASVTAPGTGTNSTAAPLLAEATYRQLPGSPTIDQGAVDSFTGTTDIDGDSRVIGAQIDMGADEMTIPTTMALACLPASLEFGAEVSCAAAVESLDGGPPTGAIKIMAAGGSEFGKCELVVSGSDQATCTVRAPVLAVHPLFELSATYYGDADRAPSQSATWLSIDPAKTAITMTCAATKAAIDSQTNCWASVANLGRSVAPPIGEVYFDASALGVFRAPSCTLIQAGPTSASCRVSYEPIALGGGSHLLDAAYVGDRGHARASAQLRLAVVRGNPSTPNTLFKRKPRTRTTRRVAVFAFSSSQPATRYQCKLDQKPFRPCHSPMRVEVGRGRHVFEVRAIGKGGIDPAPATFRWIVI